MEIDTKQNKKSFFETPGWLTISGIITIIGSVCSILSLIFPGTQNLALAIIGFIILFIGLVLIIRYARRANKAGEVEKLNMKNTIEEMQEEMKNLQVALKTHNLLVEQANNGMQHTYDSVKIEFKEKEKEKFYAFEFEKRFIIISDPAPIRYVAQFYANKILGDANRTKDFYNESENQIEWSKLNVQAFMLYKKPNEYKWEDGGELSIMNTIDNGFLIPFDIFFKQKDSNDIIELPKDTEVKLKYYYQVPVRWWGSYINRTIGYFNGTTIVRIVHDNTKNLHGLKVYRLYYDGAPVEMEKNKELLKENTYSIKSITGTQKEIILEIRGERFGRYRVTWDSKSYFNDDVETNTPPVKDDLNIARR
jgi:hypothetical protein